MTDLDPLSILATLGVASVSFELPSLTETLLVGGGVIFFLLLNAFFVASEFSSVKVRPSQLVIDHKDSKNRQMSVKAAQAVSQHLDAYLTANQVGITLASLALGFLGEPFVAKLLKPFLVITGIFNESTIQVISLVVAYACFTFCHVVIGELVPKSIAIRNPLGAALLTAPWLHRFYVAIYGVIVLFNGAANFILKHVFRIDGTHISEHAHSADELIYLVSESKKENAVTETEACISLNALELSDISVKDIMIPRNEVVTIDLNDDFATSWEKVCHTKHTRFPLVRGHLDTAVGLVHIKDLVRIINQDKPDLMSIKRELKIVPETMPADTLLRFFTKEHVHLALVVDEFGDPTGLVFLDNVITEIVGEIQDEFDQDAETDITYLSNKDEFVVRGSMTLGDLEDSVEDLSLEAPGVSTIGGYVTQQLKCIPSAGTELLINGYSVTVTGADGRKIEQLMFRKLPTTETEV